MIALKKIGQRIWRINTLKYAQSKRLISSSKINFDQNFQMYTTEQQLTVINTLHKCVQNNITRTHLNEKRLKSLKSVFEENPSLTSLEPLLNISGFGPKLLHRICDSILQDLASEGDQVDKEIPHADTKSPRKLRLPSGLLTPAYVSQVSIESVVSIKLGISTVSWARLRTSDGQLDSWDLVDISQWADKKYDVHSVYDLVMNLREDIPDGDLYVLENNNWSNVANLKKPMKYHIQEAMLTTAICSVFNLVKRGKLAVDHLDFTDLPNEVNESSRYFNLVGLLVILETTLFNDLPRKSEPLIWSDLGKEPRTEMTNRVYFLRLFTPFRLFSKIIGSERVSAEDIVLNMISGEVDERFRPISFINGTADRFLNLNGPKRDSMCQSLLLVISFTELVMFKNPTGLSIISKPLKKKKS